MNRLSTSVSRLPALLLLSIAVLAAASVVAGDGLCRHCRRSAACCQVCRLVKEEKKVAITCWACEEEPFCVPGPSHKVCKHVDYVCDESRPGEPCAKPKKFVWTEWLPSCNSKIFTHKKLMKKVETKKIPSYKWVVEDVCEACQKELQVAELPTDAAVPLPPIVNAATSSAAAAP